jgi:hypothetical protein
MHFKIHLSAMCATVIFTRMLEKNAVCIFAVLLGILNLSQSLVYKS